jgi:hypothetical protein
VLNNLSGTTNKKKPTKIKSKTVFDMRGDSRGRKSSTMSTSKSGKAVDEHKRCQGRLCYSPEADAGSAGEALVLVLQVFLEQLKQGGRFSGYLDPSVAGVGLLWMKTEHDERGLPRVSEFYMRKGGQRKFTESKRQKLEEALRALGRGHAHGRQHTTSVSVRLIDNDVGDDAMPGPLLEMHCRGEMQGDAVVCSQQDGALFVLEHAGATREVWMKTCNDERTTYHWLGERRQRKGGRPKVRCRGADAAEQVLGCESGAQASAPGSESGAQASAEVGRAAEAVASFISQQPTHECVVCRSPMPWDGVLTCPRCGVKRLKRPCLEHLAPYPAGLAALGGAGSSTCNSPSVVLPNDEEAWMQEGLQLDHAEAQDDGKEEGVRQDECATTPEDLVGCSDVEASWLRDHESESLTSSPGSRNSRSSSLEFARDVGPDDFYSLLYDDNSITRLIQTSSPLQKIVEYGLQDPSGSEDVSSSCRRPSSRHDRPKSHQGGDSDPEVAELTRETEKLGLGGCDGGHVRGWGRGWRWRTGHSLKKVGRWAPSLTGERRV